MCDDAGRWAWRRSTCLRSFYSTAATTATPWPLASRPTTGAVYFRRIDIIFVFFWLPDCLVLNLTPLVIHTQTLDNNNNIVIIIIINGRDDEDAHDARLALVAKLDGIIGRLSEDHVSARPRLLALGIDLERRRRALRR